jgi:type II secretory pathway pseudopilin PulG
MKIKLAFSKQSSLTSATTRRRKLAAFSIVEVTVGMGVVGTSMAALFSGFTAGFFTMQMARENLRATQIMLEKTETLRLYSWDQITTPGFIPATFTNTYDPNSQNKGVVYAGTLTVANAPISSSYSNNMKQVTVTVNWTTGSLNRSRTLTTYVARNGLQSYIY